MKYDVNKEMGKESLITTVRTKKERKHDGNKWEYRTCKKT